MEVENKYMYILHTHIYIYIHTDFSFEIHEVHIDLFSVNHVNVNVQNVQVYI